MKELIATVLGGLLLLALLALAGWGLGWFSLTTARPMAKYGEETRRQVFETSRAHQSGVNSAISGYCMNMRRERDPAARLALARFIQSEADTFEGQLTPSASACVAEAGTVLAAP